jgi:hypothetical protein
MIEFAPTITVTSGEAASGTVAVIPPNITIESSDLKYADKLNAPPQQISLKQLKELRGKYFTVRHIPLEECGHKLDALNEPRHRNCETCWWHWFETHPALVEAVDDAWRTQGKRLVVNLRGTHFATMFARYVVTRTAINKEREEANAVKESNSEEIQSRRT